MHRAIKITNSTPALAFSANVQRMLRIRRLLPLSKLMTRGNVASLQCGNLDSK